MNAKLRRFDPNFVADLKSATNYYDGISPTVGNKLRDEVQAKIELVASASEGSPSSTITFVGYGCGNFHTSFSTAPSMTMFSS